MLAGAIAGVALVFVALVYLLHLWHSGRGKPPVEEGDLTHTIVECPCFPDEEDLSEFLRGAGEGDLGESLHRTPEAGGKKLERGAIVRLVTLGPEHAYVRNVADRRKCWVATKWLAR
jgi:hypothetical protein